MVQSSGSSGTSRTPSSNSDAATTLLAAFRFLVAFSTSSTSARRRSVAFKPKGLPNLRDIGASVTAASEYRAPAEGSRQRKQTERLRRRRPRNEAGRAEFVDVALRDTRSTTGQARQSPPECHRSKTLASGSRMQSSPALSDPRGPWQNAEEMPPLRSLHLRSRRHRVNR